MTGFQRGFNFFLAFTCLVILIFLIGMYILSLFIHDGSPFDNEHIPLILGFLFFMIILGFIGGIMAGYQTTEETIQISIQNEKDFMFYFTSILSDLHYKQVPETTSHITFEASYFYHPGGPIRIKFDQNVVTIIAPRLAIKKIKKEWHKIQPQQFS